MFTFRRGPTLRTLIDELLFARTAEGRAPRTVEWYRSRLASFVELAGDRAARDVDPELVRRWLVRVREGRRHPTRDITVASHRAAAASLFTWAVREGRIARSPMERVAKIRVRRRVIAVLEENDVARLLAACASTALGARDRAIISFLYDTGARVGELVALRRDDVRLAEGIALVRGKTGERRLPLGMRLRATLLAYVQARPRAFAFADPPELFLGRRGRALTENGVGQMLDRIARAARLAVHVHPHLLRHSFATQYIRNGGDPYTLQIILGHSTPAMVTRYMHMAARDAEERHALASPLDQLPLAVAR